MTVTGTVNLYIDKFEKKLSRIRNVEGVRDHVTVPGNVSDEQLRQTLGDRLGYDRKCVQRHRR